METKVIEIGRIQMGMDVHTRASIRKKKLNELIEAIKAGTPIPPIDVYRNGDRFFIADGFHRFEAAISASKTDILANIHVGNRSDAIIRGIKQNAASERGRTDGDKNTAVRLLLENEYITWSDEEISQICSVSQKRIDIVRKQLSGRDDEPLRLRPNIQISAPDIEDEIPAPPKKLGSMEAEPPNGKLPSQSNFLNGSEGTMSSNQNPIEKKEEETMSAKKAEKTVKKTETATNKRKKAKEVKKLSLKKISAIDRVQSRAEMNEATVAEYADLINRGVELPPLEVFFDGSEYYLADGFHRYKAAKEVGQKKVKVIVHKGKIRDAIAFAAGANTKHGLPRTHADKRRAVTQILTIKAWQKKSDSLVAEHCGVSPTFVGKIRRESTQHYGKTDQKTEGKDGRKRNTSNIGRKSGPKAAINKVLRDVEKAYQSVAALEARKDEIADLGLDEETLEKIQHRAEEMSGASFYLYSQFA